MRSWNRENGLPNNNVYALEQTTDGYMWIGTHDGLACFDGINFQLYNKENVLQLEDDEIHALHEDSNGILWIGTENGGLTGYKNGEFFTYPVTKYKVLHKIRAINQDHRGNLWIGSYTRGLTCLSSNSFTTYTRKEGLPDNGVNSIFKDINGYLWITTGNGIVKLIEPGVFQNAAAKVDLPYLMNCCIYAADQDELWIGTFVGGLFRMQNGNYTAFNTRAGLPHWNINCLLMDGMRNLWIGSDGGGLGRLNKGTFAALPSGDILASGFVYSLYEDRENTLWVGTLDGGLNQFWDNKFTTYTIKEGLAHEYVNCIWESHSGDLWIGTQEGLNRLRDGRITTLLTKKEGLADNRIASLYEDPEGYLWIGAWGGLHRFKNGSLTTLTKKNGLSDHRIKYITGDREGNTWVGTKNGLNRFDHNTGTFIIFTKKQGLLGNNIEFIFADSKGNLWISSTAGINRFNSGKITAFNPGARLENIFFKCAYEDSEGVLWFGTGNGLIRLQGEEITLYTNRCGLFENYVISILEDQEGCFWLGGRNGISRVSKKELADFAGGLINRVRSKTYNEQDGMKSGWCTNAGCKNRDGRLWFPTSVGVTTIDPGNIRQNALAPPLIIEKLIADSEYINVHTGLNEKTPVKLRAGTKRLEFFYTGVSFTAPEKIKFKLKLIGYDKDWVDRGNLRSITYTELSPGPYTFEVKACNPDGVWNKQATSFSFYLQPYFHQTTWFYLLLVLSVMLLGFSFYRFRVRQLRAREKELGSLVSLRTKDLRERNTELEKARRKIQRSKEIIEEKNRNIMDSMRYARKIQQAMLPWKEKMAKELQEYFVIYKPKDIVSGDFYWFDVIEDHYFLALADCTGHGVPGALLAMMGYMMLSEVVNERHIFDPAMILARLHQGFRYILKQEMEETDTYDGMDIGLCRIDLPTGKITYAGARRPLYYIKNSKLIEIKGDRKSIGGRQTEVKHVFTNHDIDIENEIMIYLTSDGFADQQDSRNRKYGSRRLKNYFQGHAHLSAAQQEETLLKELRRHMANEEQRDDITIIGIRIHNSLE